MNALEVINLTKQFDKTLAVDHVSFAVESGEVFGFLGPNGAGKSTTIKMITGFMTPTAGSVRIFGQDPFKESMQVKRLIGVVPEELQLYDRLSGGEFVEFVARMYELENYEDRMMELFEMLDLKAHYDTLIMEYSHGMKKKLAFLSAVIHEPRILFLDEPFTGMDALSVIKVRNFIKLQADRGVCVFFSSHILELVEKLCDRIGIIDHSKLKGLGTREALLTQFRANSLEDIFLETSIA